LSLSTSNLEPLEKLGENTFLMFGATQFVEFCYGNSRKLIQGTLVLNNLGQKSDRGRMENLVREEDNEERVPMP
jgi:hypothetical protein